MTRIYIEFLYLEDVWPIAQSLIQRFEGYQKVNDVLKKDNCIQSLLAYSVEYWPSYLREACLSESDPVVSQILPFYQVDSRLYDV